MPVKGFFFRLFVATGLISASVISFQVILTQIFSITQWYHFAFMVVSLAMLGFGASGTILTLYRRWFLKHTRFLLPLLQGLTGLFMAVVVTTLQWELFRFDSYLLFVEGREFISLLFSLILLFLPFFTGGLFAGLVFFRYSSRISRLYFFDLIGAGLGAVLAIIFMWLFLPWQSPPVLGLLPLAGGLILLHRKSGLWIKCTLALFFMTVLISGFLESSLPYSQYKDISTDLQLPDARLEYQGSSPHGLTEVVSSPALRYAPALSLTFTGEIPVSKMMYNNGNGYGPVWQWNRESEKHLMDYSVSGLSFRLAKPGNAFFPDMGTGTGITQALTHDFEKVYGTTHNAHATNVLRNILDTLEDANNYIEAENVHIRNVHTRSFLAETTESFDLINFPLQGAFGGGAGLEALQEDFHLTKESFSEAWDLLNPGGYIEISLWMDYPYRAPVRMAATLTEVLEENNINNPRDHLLAIRSWGVVSYIVSKDPINDEDTREIRAFCSEMNFDPVLLPDIQDEERTRFNAIEDEDYFALIDALLDEDRESLYKAYAFNIHPATDNRPYFSQFIKWSDVSELRELFGQETIPFFELGYLLLIVTFIATAVLSLFFIVLPLISSSRPGRGKLPVLLYFTGIGTGFMFVEMIFIQQLILVLGHPSYAIAVVISLLLIASGTGSWFSARIRDPGLWFGRISAVLVLLLLLYALLFGSMVQMITGAPFFLRILALVMLIGLPGILMGFPFPLGISYLYKHAPEHIPWAWGINGCSSVLSSALAIIVLVERGVGFALAIAALAYLLVLLARFIFLAFFRN